ncbi:MAG: hypothetical protein LBD96_03890 [Treponema sp.]|jgi:hypothetical protein|nr:hypothetical protein [Treponema sp.]
MQKCPAIVNIVNFIRAVEPRVSMDLYEPVREQLALLEKYGLRGTFLLQYDALLDETYAGMLRGTPHEIGVWLEIMEPLVKDCGLAWRGRFPWDWHSHVGFSVGYTPEERERLIDRLMEQFRAVFGVYPKSAGSWMIDAHSLAYLADTYHISASANCKEQWGTDGYTIWGGYYNQAYYPSRTNALAPGGSAETQIPLPVFRMLGSDPVLQYDYGLSTDTGAAAVQGVITLEPVYTGSAGGGGVPAWVDWFFDEVMTGCCLSFNYAQAGQENSFGWPAMKNGLIYQIEELSALSKAGKIRIETLAESGDWFRSKYPLTPNSATTALSDWKNEGKRSVWFCSRKYRVNFYSEGGTFWLRDLMMFDDTYAERYLRDTCTNENMTYDNLPVIDGNRWSGRGKRAGWYFRRGGEVLAVKDCVVEDAGGGELRLLLRTDDGRITITCRTDSLEIRADAGFDFHLEMVWGASAEMDGAGIGERELKLRHEGFAYEVRLSSGFFRNRTVVPEGGRCCLSFSPSCPSW